MSRPYQDPFWESTTVTDVVVDREVFAKRSLPWSFIAEVRNAFHADQSATHPVEVECDRNALENYKRFKLVQHKNRRRDIHFVHVRIGNGIEYLLALFLAAFQVHADGTYANEPADVPRLQFHLPVDGYQKLRLIDNILDVARPRADRVSLGELEPVFAFFRSLSRSPSDERTPTRSPKSKVFMGPPSPIGRPPTSVPLPSPKKTATMMMSLGDAIAIINTYINDQDGKQTTGWDWIRYLARLMTITTLLANGARGGFGDASRQRSTAKFEILTGSWYPSMKSAESWRLCVPAYFQPLRIKTR